MTELPTADIRLTRLLTRLLTAAEASFAAGDVETARATAEEVRAVDPTNERASRLLRRLDEPQQAPVGQRALMTLLFSDLVGSTMMSEQVEPEQLRDLFALYRATSGEAVERYGGVVMQYMGDGILAGFGFPEAHEDDARRAVLAGLDLVAAMGSMQADLARHLGVAPQVRVGLHTGRVLVTDITRDRSVLERDSIVGVAPNLAARIQGAAAPGQVVISDVTQHLVESDFFVQSLGERELKGISRPVEVFAVERPRHAGARFHAERYRRVSLVGRDEQRATLVAAWNAVQAGDRVHVGQHVPGRRRAGHRQDTARGGCREQRRVHRGARARGGLPAVLLQRRAVAHQRRCWRASLAASGDTGDRLQLLVDHLTSLGIDPARSIALPQSSDRRLRGSALPGARTRPERGAGRDADPVRRVDGRTRRADTQIVRGGGPALGGPIHVGAARQARSAAPARGADGGDDTLQLGDQLEGRGSRAPPEPPQRRGCSRPGRHLDTRPDRWPPRSAPPSSSGPKASRCSSRS